MFLPNVPGSMFIPGATSIPESRVPSTRPSKFGAIPPDLHLILHFLINRFGFILCLVSGHQKFVKALNNRFRIFSNSDSI